MPHRRLLSFLEDPRNVGMTLIVFGIVIVILGGFLLLTVVEHSQQADKVEAQRSAIVAQEEAITLLRIGLRQKEQETKRRAREAVAACQRRRPRDTKLIASLRDFFREAEVSSQQVLELTPRSDPLYETRRKAVLRNRELASILASLLPIRCGDER